MLAVRPSLTSAGVLIGTGERVSPGLGCSDWRLAASVRWVAGRSVADGSVDPCRWDGAPGLPGSAPVVLEEPGLGPYPGRRRGAAAAVIRSTTMITLMHQSDRRGHERDHQPPAAG